MATEGSVHLFYQLVLALGSLFLFPYWLVRSRFAPEIRHHLAERFGAAPSPPRPRPIWIQAASVGEVRIAALLIDAWPGTPPPFVLSVTTPAGRQVAHRDLAARVDTLFFFPFDFGFAVRRALRRIAPAAFVAIETEIWPTLFRACRRRGIPHGIVNGRISSRSFGRYRAVRPWIAAALGGLDFLCAQDAAAGDRFRRLGAAPARVQVTGNMKYHFRPDPAARDRLGAALGLTGNGWWWVAGSTRTGEEEIVLHAFAAARQKHPDLRLVLAPRHPGRFADAAERIEQAGFPVVRRSSLPAPVGEPPAVILLDSLGELTQLYGLARCAFVGGSLVPKGGHNPIEPAAWGVPVLFGPHMENFAPIAAALRDAGGAWQEADADGLAARIDLLRSDRELHRRAGKAAADCARLHRGAVERTIASIEAAIGGSRAAAPRSWSAPWLRPLSWLYAGAVGWRNRRYDRDAGRARRAAVPVVSIGNLVVGGTGKTPVTVGLARQLRNAGWSPAIISRGYRRRGRERLASTRFRPGAAPPAPSDLGDEPAWMARRLPDTAVVVCADRIRAARHAVERYGADLILLDDGFQHRRLHRDLDLVLIDALDPFGNGRLLPAGPLREPPAALRRADAVLLTRWDLCPGGDALRGEVRRWIGPDTPLFPFRQRAVGVRAGADGPVAPLDRLAGVAVLAFAGIGHPASFAAEVDRSPLHRVASLWFRDHHPYSAADCDRIDRVAREAGAEVLLTTEKDRIRFPEERCPLPLYSLEVALEPIEADRFAAFLQRRLPSPPVAATGIAH